MKLAIEAITDNMFICKQCIDKYRILIRSKRFKKNETKEEYKRMIKSWKKDITELKQAIKILREV